MTLKRLSKVLTISGSDFKETMRLRKVLTINSGDFKETTQGTDMTMQGTNNQLLTTSAR